MTFGDLPLNGAAREPDPLVIADAVTVLGIVMTTTDDVRQPAVAFAFKLPDGTVLPTVVLLADDDALLAITDKVRDAVRTARQHREKP